MKYDAVVFDMDGLLVDSETVWFQAEAEVIEARGHVYTQDVREKIIGMRMDEFVVVLAEHYHFTDSVDSIIQEMNDTMLRMIPQYVTAQPGAQELITYLHEAGVPMAIASSSPVSIIESIVSLQGWQDIIPVRCSAEHEVAGKPAPDVYLAAARALGVAPERCLALEDSANGARAAIAAGMTCYGVPDAAHKGQPVFAGVTSYIFYSLNDVLALLSQEWEA